jgi:two-component system phosphate regulon response regulator OmpR
MRARILIVEDDLHARALLEEFLVRQGFGVSTLSSGQQAVDVVSRDCVSLVLLDLGLPGEGGLSICARLRASGANVPVIMLTGKGEAIDRIVGLESGADDYVVKPFDPRELLARISAVLRRNGALVEPGAPTQPALVYRFGPFELDTARHIFTRDRQVLTLTRGEFAVLEALVRHPLQPLSRERLFRLARRRSFVTSDRSMDIQVSRLRRLIETDVSKPRYIQTVWGLGYVFVPQGEGSPE